MKKYEYMRLSDKWGEQVTLNLLNLYGVDGWEVKHVYPIDIGVSGKGFEYLLERELREENEKEMD